MTNNHQHNSLLIGILLPNLFEHSPRSQLWAALSGTIVTQQEGACFLVTSAIIYRGCWR
jgi:hypothetical protein